MTEMTVKERPKTAMLIDVSKTILLPQEMVFDEHDPGREYVWGRPPKEGLPRLGPTALFFNYGIADETLAHWLFNHKKISKSAYEAIAAKIEEAGSMHTEYKHTLSVLANEGVTPEVIRSESKWLYDTFCKKYDLIDPQLPDLVSRLQSKGVAAELFTASMDITVVELAHALGIQTPQEEMYAVRTSLDEKGYANLASNEPIDKAKIKEDAAADMQRKTGLTPIGLVLVGDTPEDWLVDMEGPLRVVPYTPKGIAALAKMQSEGLTGTYVRGNEGEPLSELITRAVPL